MTYIHSVHAQPQASLESTQSMHRVFKAHKYVVGVTHSLQKLSLTIIIKKIKIPKSTQFGPENTVPYQDNYCAAGPITVDTHQSQSRGKRV